MSEESKRISKVLDRITERLERLDNQREHDAVVNIISTIFDDLLIEDEAVFISPFAMFDEGVFSEEVVFSIDMVDNLIWNEGYWNVDVWK